MSEETQANKLRSLHWSMAKARLERGDTSRALEAMRQALLATPIESLQGPAIDTNDMAEMQIDLGEILKRLGLADDANRAFERASAATQEATLTHLAEVSFRFNLWQEAQDVLQRNVDLHPDSPTAHRNLAHTYVERWQLEDALASLAKAEALASLAKAEALAPQPGARFIHASMADRMGDADTAIRIKCELAEEEGPKSSMRSSVAMSALYSDQLSAQEVASLHRELFLPLAHGERARSSFKNKRDPVRPLRIGMVTAVFQHQHPVNIFMQPVLARLDPKEFDVTVYYVGVSYDEQTRVAQRRVTQWVEATKWSDTQLAKWIEDDRSDILLDLTGHSQRNRVNVFGQRAAPVQATFLGCPHSTWVPNMDWMLGDDVVSPPEHEDLYSEHVIRLPGTVFCFAPEADYPLLNPGPDAQLRPLTFGSFNNILKLTPRTIRLWSRVLLAVPNSRLVLKAQSFRSEKACEAFRIRFAAEGINPERLEFRGPSGLTEMMAEYNDVDIGLDTVPHNGGTTPLQAMWIGVPVIVLKGNNFVSRMGASFMSAAGLHDWVAKDDETYVEIATKMATDSTGLLTLKRTLQTHQLKNNAWDIDLHCKNFSAALR